MKVRSLINDHARLTRLGNIESLLLFFSHDAVSVGEWEYNSNRARLEVIAPRLPRSILEIQVAPAASKPQ